jgi:hypothetical protein
MKYETNIGTNRSFGRSIALPFFWPGGYGNFKMEQTLHFMFGQTRSSLVEIVNVGCEYIWRYTVTVTALNGGWHRTRTISV